MKQEEMDEQQLEKTYNANDGRQMGLIDQLTRTRVFNFRYWKEECFGLTAVSLVDKAIKIDSIGVQNILYQGGTYAGTAKPTHFLCLLMKLLQINPDQDIIYEFLKNRDYKYVNALAMFYLRMTGKPQEIYIQIEKFLSDFRKLRMRNNDGTYSLMYMDEYADRLLQEEQLFSINLPRLHKRIVLEDQGVLQPRQSPLDQELVKREKSRSRSKEK
ncbi:hypothetical protein pb186bvf_003318 [Paramecium bursaria]